MIDGDTIEIGGQRIRLFGIDAPELQQTCEAGGSVYACGIVSALALARLISDRIVVCEQRSTDRNGRPVDQVGVVYRRVVAHARVISLSP